MRKQDYLVGLIAALTPNEKRYFKLFTSLQPGEKRYLKLFDALENKSRYESAELCIELGTTASQLADDKLYLTQILLQSLRNYDQEGTELTVLRNNRENVQSLMNRRMFSFAIDLTEKTIERSFELEAFDLIDGLLLLRSSCRQNLNQIPDKDDTLEQHDRAAKRLAEIIEMTSLRGQARTLEMSDAAIKRYEKVLSNRLMKGGAAKLNSMRAKSLWYETMAHYYSAQDDGASLLKLARAERELYLKNPAIKIINPIVYITNIFRLAESEGDFEVRQQLLSMLQKELADPEIKLSHQRRDSIVWGSTLMNLWNLRHLHRFKEAMSLAEKAYTQGQSRSEFDRFSSGFEYALVLLHNDKATRAAEVLDEMLRYKPDIRFQSFVRIMHIMAQLDLRNYELIPHAIKATRFWLKKKEGDKAEINLFLKHAGQIAKGPVNKSEEWKKLYQGLEDKKMESINSPLQLSAWVKEILRKARTV